MISRLVTVRYPIPLPTGVWLGAVVRQQSHSGTDVVGVVTGVYRAPADDWLPLGVFIETTLLP